MSDGDFSLSWQMKVTANEYSSSVDDYAFLRRKFMNLKIGNDTKSFIHILRNENLTNLRDDTESFIWASRNENLISLRDDTKSFIQVLRNENLRN